MEKRLEDMSLEELWQLFPITMSRHNSKWKSWAEMEIDNLSRILSEFHPLIHHIGSTAIPDIMAKPIVDIMVELNDNTKWGLVRSLLIDDGYICMAESSARMSFNKGYTVEGYAEKVFHVHIHLAGDNEEIRFRDYLIAHADVAREYEALKLRLLPRFRTDRDGYTAAKTQFIRQVLLMGTKCEDA